ncbi:class I SAM-dependent methyltransferase [Bradyrhizobium sp. WYCCWR 13023]|uniref:Class I SAM-dependent methyltransferase n=1 Tax=Bradyrhizobium zhengyangense TaxID=2911009 RepID=A0A9X1UCT7_9BRAD|nr:methyltransferase domain-containing protein [Bradyrhizobium zhengyangense]MCG2630704.1 class I SAM-dependent methyltransferase [Bradyrhizobium zhengyangense]
MNDPNSLAIRAGVSERVAEISPDRQARVVDLACGEGELLARLEELGFSHLTGIGWKVAVPPSAKKVDCVDLSVVGWADLLGGATFDVLTATEVLEHLVNPYEFLVQVRRLANPGGRLIMTFPNVHNLRSIVGYAVSGRYSGFFGPNWNDNHPLYDQHIFVPNHELVRYFLKLSGFEVLSVDYLFGRGKLFGTTAMFDCKAVPH